MAGGWLALAGRFLAARLGRAALANLNHERAAELGGPLRMGTGLPVGPAIVGALGYGRRAQLGAIDGADELASRLEALPEELEVELVASEELLARTGCPLADAERRLVELRGRSGRLGRSPRERGGRPARARPRGRRRAPQPAGASRRSPAAAGSSGANHFHTKPAPIAPLIGTSQKNGSWSR